jgi:hypothetical protein
MPAIAFLAWVGLALVALLFVADATLIDQGPAIVVSQRIGLPEPWHPDPDPAQTSTANLIPTPDMASQPAISNQPASEPEGQPIKPAALAARAEALPKREKRLVTRQPTKRPQNHVQQKQVQQSSLFDRFSIRDQ